MFVQLISEFGADNNLCSIVQCFKCSLCSRLHHQLKAFVDLSFVSFIFCEKRLHYKWNSVMNVRC